MSDVLSGREQSLVLIICVLLTLSIFLSVMYSVQTEKQRDDLQKVVDVCNERIRECGSVTGEKESYGKIINWTIT